MDLKRKPLYVAAIARFEAQKQEALATIDIYLNNSVGIGEHSNLLDEVEEKISVLTAHFGKDQ